MVCVTFSLLCYTTFSLYGMYHLYVDGDEYVMKMKTVYCRFRMLNSLVKHSLEGNRLFTTYTLLKYTG